MKMAHESHNEGLPTVRDGLARVVMALSMVSKPVLGSNYHRHSFTTSGLSAERASDVFDLRAVLAQSSTASCHQMSAASLRLRASWMFAG